MTNEVLDSEQMRAADREAVKRGVSSLELMEAAGAGVAAAVAERWSPRRAIVLCGPGNNGGDGFVAARRLRQDAWDVSVALLGPRDRLTGDAAEMAQRWRGPTAPFEPQSLSGVDLVIDAMFGVGLSRPMEGAAREMVRAVNASAAPVAAVDVPSGLDADTGRPLGDAVIADVTVTFFRKKIGHLLYPGRGMCGDLKVVDIGIEPEVLETIRPRLRENAPVSWREAMPWPALDTHKYRRGHALVMSGPAHRTGAARLAAAGALRIGAGLVTVASGAEAVPINAAHLTAVMVEPVDGAEDLLRLVKTRKVSAAVIGPGAGATRATATATLALLTSCPAAVLDADALTAFEGDPAALFDCLGKPAILTPHQGEFERLFKSAASAARNRIEAAATAAREAGAVVVLKGPDTVIAEPGGAVAINTNAPPDLATAGSGDVLAGFAGGLLAQGMGAFEAACAAVWIHGAGARRFGPGLTAEDLPDLAPQVLAALQRGEAV